MAANITSKFGSLEETIRILLNHKKGGENIPRDELLEDQRQRVQAYKERDTQALETMTQSAVDKTSQENIAREKDTKNLAFVNIKNLKAGVIQDGSILNVKIISQCYKLSSCTMYVEDDNKDIIQLCLYNQIAEDSTYQQVQRAFPRGLKLGVLNPYKKMTYNGNVVLRNDNP